MLAAASGILIVALSVGVFLAMRAPDEPQRRSQVSIEQASSGTAPEALPTKLDATTTPVPAGKGYSPRVSEKKLEQLLEERKSWNVTEDQVYALMGQPTRRTTQITGRKNGQVFTAYTAYWEVPGSGIQSSVTFANGRVAGVVLALEITLPGSSPRN